MKFAPVAALILLVCLGLTGCGSASNEEQIRQEADELREKVQADIRESGAPDPTTPIGGQAKPKPKADEAKSGKVEVEVLGVRENPPLPDWVGDDVFNKNHTVIGIKVRVTNNTGRVQLPDFYLKGADDDSGYDDYPPGTSSLTATELDAGESVTEEHLFGMLSEELPAKELVVIEPFDDKVLFTQKLN